MGAVAVFGLAVLARQRKRNQPSQQDLDLSELTQPISPKLNEPSQQDLHLSELTQPISPKLKDPSQQDLHLSELTQPISPRALDPEAPADDPPLVYTCTGVSISQ